MTAAIKSNSHDTLDFLLGVIDGDTPIKENRKDETALQLLM
jgi:hypothetical protein